MSASNESPNRPLYVIAAEIRRTWVTKDGRPNVNYGAEPYLEALEQVVSVHDTYGVEPVKYIIPYFLNNATSWRGEDAKRIKAELKALLK